MKKIIKEDELYPQQLMDLENPPNELYTLGNTNLFDTYSIAIIGSRASTPEGRKVARKFARELAVQGITIVSGMARGIDSMAHRGALEVGGNTIAVLGSGFDNIFPPENENLFKEIVERGLVVSEYPPNETVKKENFPKRNRIVCGLSLGVLIIEAEYRSGTSITARLAYKYGKEIFCIPWGINNAHGVGTNRLIKYGKAKLVTNVQEIMEEFSFLKYSEEKANRLKIRKPKVDSKYEEIFRLINFKPIDAEEICRETQKNISEVNIILTMLELQGYIKKVAGGFIWDTNKQ